MRRADRKRNSPNFSDKATFHVYEKVNRHNVRVWGSENPHATIEHIRDSRKLNVFCSISREKVYGPFFPKATVTGMPYLEMMQEWLMLQLHDHSNAFIYQQDGALPQLPQTAFATTLDWMHGCQ
ncbi:hypothetical protein L798_05309 [Zootermopsis nevadensis]|uniref:Uncharacterized protein n=1 Tax=Zootermopsis nevadensis TaxID=136037 RepID=A0A067RJZ5_ZOONE|nr:hypothetical protein L798_05309 [Zootermopsis nevadensis]